MTDILKSPAGNPLGLFVDIEWNGDVARRLIAASIRLQDYEVLLRTIGRKVVLSIQRNFMEQRTPQGVPWQPLKKPRRKGHNPDSRALLDSLNLYNSITYEQPTKNEVDIGFGTEAFYGSFQNDGTRHIPARQFLGLRDGDLPDLEAFASAHARQAFEAA